MLAGLQRHRWTGIYVSGAHNVHDFASRQLQKLCCALVASRWVVTAQMQLEVCDFVQV
eukprot:COSAG01_NODE_1314_length_10760_cov_3.305131_5_plen_58_part_00